jgi:hypothetical protein
LTSPRIWFIIQNNVNLRLKEETSKHYNKLNNKLNKLIKQSEEKENMINMTKQTFYPRLHNMTNVQLSKMEEILLYKGSKYNMDIAPKKSIKQLVCETENAVRHLNINQQEATRHITSKNIQQIISKQHNKQGIQRTNMHYETN